MRNHLLAFVMAFMVFAMVGQSLSAQTVYLLNENFDQLTSGIPAGWDNSAGSSTSAAYRWTSHVDGYNGTRGLRFDSYSQTAQLDNYLVTPSLNLAAGQWLLTFRYRNPSGGPFSVFISTDDGATYTTPIQENLPNTNDWVEKSYSLTTLAAGSSTVKIVFRGESNYGPDGAYIYLDDVTVESAPTCKAPVGMSISNLLQTSATLNWGYTPDGTVPDTLILSVTDAAGNAVISGRRISAPQQSYSLTGLTAGTVYNVSLQGDCNAAYQGFSNTATLTFATTCYSMAAPYTENFDALTDLPACTMGRNAEISSAMKRGASGQSVRLSTTVADDAYIIFPELQLNANNVEMSLFARAASVSDGAASYMVALVPDAGDLSDIDVLYVDSLTNTQWTEIRMNTTGAYDQAATTARLGIFFTSGFVRDINIDDVSLHAIPTCLRPENLQISNVTATTADFAWTVTNAANATIMAITATDTTYVRATSNPFTVTGLRPNTDYTFLIRGICSASDSSEINPYPVTCHTLCSLASTALFQEGFEAVNAANTAPECWTQGWLNHVQSSLAVAPFTMTTSYKHSGSRAMSFARQTAGQSGYLSSQQLPIDQAGKYMASIWVYRQNAAQYPNERLKLWVNTVENSTAGATLLGTISRDINSYPTEPAAGWYQYEFPINAAGNLYLIIEGDAQDGGAIIFDDVEVSLVPACPRPAQITFAAPGTNSLDMTWTSNGTETQWIVNYELRDAQQTLLSDSTAVVNNTPALTVGGLTPAVSYSLVGQIRSICAPGDTSAAKDFTINFTTACSVVDQFPYTEGFEGTQFPPLCWTSGALSGSNRWSREANSEYGTGAGTAKVVDAQVGALPLLSSQPLRFTAGTPYEVRFSIYRSGSYPDKYNEGVYVYVGPNAADTIGAVRLGFIPQAYTNPPAENAAGLYSYTFAVPATASGDQRVIFVYANQYGSGSYIDDVLVRQTPTCQDVAGACQLMEPTSSSVRVVITDTTVTDWQVSVVPSGAQPDAATAITVSGRMDTVVAGLAAQTAYDVYVRRVCTGETGDWSGARSITTLCNAATVPFFDDFESYTVNTVLGGCYSVSLTDGVIKVFADQNDGDDNTNVNSTAGGSKGLCSTYGDYADYPGTISNDMLLTRYIHLEAGTNYKISVYTKAGYYSWSDETMSYDLTFRIGKSTAEMINIGQPFLIDFKNFAQRQAYFTVAETGDYIVGLRTSKPSSVTDSWYSYYPYVDDLGISVANCIPPTQAIITSLGQDSANIAITSTATAWEVAVSAAPIDIRYTVTGEVYSNANLTSKNVTIPGLTPNTEYYYTFRSLCNGEPSDWMQPETFRTRCNVFNTPYTEDFELNRSITCWSTVGTTGSITRETSQHHNGGSSMKLDNVSAVSPEFNVNGSFATYMVNGWAYSTSDNASMGIGLMIDPADPSTYQDFGQITISPANTWVEFTAYFTDLTGDEYADFLDARHIVLATGNDVVYVDDLMVDVTATCPKPTEGTITDVQPRQITADWRENGTATQWIVRAVPQDGSATVEAAATAHPYTLTGLRAATSYTLYIAAVCSASDTSLFTQVTNFTTGCDFVTGDFYETFEGFAQDALPMCWDNSGSTATASTASNLWGVYYVDNNRSIRMVNFYVRTGAAVINTPEIILEAGKNYILEFDYANQADCGPLLAKIRRHSETVFTDIPGAAYPALGNSTSYSQVSEWSNASVAINGYAGDTVQIQFYADANYSDGAIFVDNVRLIEQLNCSDIRGLSITSLNSTSVTAAWTDTCSAHSQWQYAVIARGRDIANATLAVTTGNPLTVGNLTPGTAYDLYVRAYCGDGDYSHWTTIPFTTPGTPAQVPYICNFSNDADNAAWVLSRDAQNRFVIGTDPRAVISGTKALYITDDNSTYHFDINENSLSTAARPIEFGEGEHTVEIDWRCSGGISSYDFARMYLVPAYSSIAPAAPGANQGYNMISWPNDMIALDGGTYQNRKVGSQRTVTTVDMTGRAGVYYLVFVWYNIDNNSADQYPLSVDNVAVRRLACAKVTGIYVPEETITTTTAVAHFDNPTGDRIHWIVSGSSVAADSIVSGFTTADSAVIAGISPSRSYKFLARRECSASDVSVWNEDNFNSLCDVITTYPVSEDFERLPYPSLCWSHFSTAAGTDYYGYSEDGAWERYNPSYSSSYLHGTAGVQMVGDGAGAALVSPELHFDSTYEYHVDFSAYLYSTVDYQDGDYKLYINTRPDLNGATLVRNISAYKAGLNAYTQGLQTVSVDMPLGLNGNYYVIFEGRSGQNAVLYMDDIVIDQYPVCRELTENPTIEATTATTATVSVAFGRQTAIEFGVAPYSTSVTPLDITSTIVSQNGRAVFTGLTPAAQYAFFARAICSNTGDTTAWTYGTVGRTHDDDCFAPENIRVVGVVGPNAVTICWNDIPNAATCTYEAVSATDTVSGTTTNDTAVITGLTPNTRYTFRVRGACTGGTTTADGSFTFSTPQTPATLPYVCGFEDLTENALWQNIASTSNNNFVIGTDANGRFSGTRGLYISTDGSTYSQAIPTATSQWDNTLNVAFFTRTVYFPSAGRYEVGFDWKCDATAQGSSWYSSYEAYGRSFIMPQGTSLVSDADTYASTAYPLGAIGLISKMANQAAWTSYHTIVDIPAEGYQDIVFAWVAVNEWGGASDDEASETPLAIDNVSINEVSCMIPASIATTSVSATGATVTVTKVDNVDLEYAISTSSSTDSLTDIRTLTATDIIETLTFDSLTPAVTYYVFARQVCDAQDKSSWVRCQFSTTALPAELPYVCGFENATENNNWQFVQEGQQNYFTIGSNVNNGGTSALYITNDGVTNGYETDDAPSVSYAQRVFYLEPGTYTYAFDWMCNGESTYDYAYAYLAPVSSTVTAGVEAVPQGAIRLFSGDRMNQQTTWAHQAATFDITTANSYNLIFVWKNDNTDGNQSPLAIDNVELAAMACATPSVTTSDAGLSSVSVRFVNQAAGADIVYAVAGNGTWAGATVIDTLYNVSDTTITVNGLSASTAYTVLARALCSDNEQSPDGRVTFVTECGTVSHLPYFEDFEGFPGYQLHSSTAGVNEIANYCWVAGSTSPNNYVQVQNSTSKVQSGSQSLVLDGNNGSMSDVTVAALPLMDSISSLNVTLYHAGAAYSSNSDVFEVGYLTSPSYSSFVAIQSLPYSVNMTEASVSMAAAPATAKRIAFRYTGYNYWYVDDVSVTRMVEAAPFNDTVCFTSGYTANGFNLTSTQVAVGDNVFTRVRRAVAVGEADTLFTANVYKRADIRTVYYDTICAGIPYPNSEWNIPNPQTQRYFQTLRASNGCDSTVDLYLTVLPSSRIYMDTICAGGSYAFGDQNITTAGTYSRTYTSALGCQMTDTVILVVLPDSIITRETICGDQVPYQWNGQSITASGTYTSQVTGAHGCSQTEVLVLNVLVSDSVITAHYCAGGQVQVVDTFISTSGTYTLERVNYGCEITYHITVTEDPVLTGTASDYVCQGQLYYGNGINGLAVTADTVVSISTKTASMCDSVTNVSIHYVPTVYYTFNETIPAGQSYTWNDQTYNEPGSYTDTLQTSEGCDSVVTLNLSVIDGVDNVLDNGRMRIVPNPARAGAQTLVFTEQTGRIVRVEIINSFGATVESREPQSTPIDITAPQAAGVYHVRITTADGRVYVEKLIVR